MGVEHTIDTGGTALFHSAYIPGESFQTNMEEGMCIDYEGTVPVDIPCSTIEQHEKYDILVNLNREGLHAMVEYMLEVGADMDLILNTLNKGSWEFYQITGE